MEFVTKNCEVKNFRAGTSVANIISLFEGHLDERRQRKIVTKENGKLICAVIIISLLLELRSIESRQDSGKGGGSHQGFTISYFQEFL